MYINSFLHLSNSTQHHIMTVKSIVQQSLQSLLDKERYIFKSLFG